MTPFSRLRAGLPLLPVLFFAGCASHRIEAPSMVPYGTEPAPLPASTLSIPVNVGLDPLRDQILQGIPRPLSSGTMVKTLEFKIKPPAATSGGLGGLMGKALSATGNSDLSVKAPVETELRHRVDIQKLDLVAQGPRLTATVVLEMSLGTTLRAPVSAFGVASCGENEARPQLEFTLPGILLWGKDGQVEFHKEQWSMRWLRPCNLTAFQIDVGAVANLPLVRQKVEEAVTKGLERLPQSFALRPVAEKAWKELSTPRSLQPGVWFVAQPESLGFSALRGTGKTLTTVVNLQARPRIVSSDVQPAVTLSPMPGLKLSRAGDGIHLDLAGEVALERADSLLTAVLSAKPLKAGGKTAVITKARLYPAGERAVLGITLAKPFAGEIYLTGHPVYDTLSNRLVLDSLEFSLATRSALVKSAEWLLHGTIRDALQENAKVDFGPLLPKLRQSVSKLQFPAGSGITVQGGISRLQPRAVHISPTAVRAHIQADGQLQVLVGGK